MKHFALEGRWWLPESATRQVPGTLTFDEDGLELVLYDALRPVVASEDQAVGVGPEWQVEPIVHGRTRDRRDFTLLEVGGANLVGPFEQVQEVYRPEMTLDGCHTEVDLFAEAWCSFDYLDAWADAPPVALRGDDPGVVRVRRGDVDLGSAELGNASIRLVSGVEGTSSDARVDVARRTAFAITPTDSQPARLFISDYVRPLQDLLMFCLGRAVRLTSFRLLPTDLPDPREGTAAVSFSAVQSTKAKAPTLVAIVSYGAPTILRLGDGALGCDELLSRWFGLWREHRDVFTLLHAPLIAPFIFGEHGFSSTFQSAEALHDLVLDTRDVAKVDHAKRVELAVRALESANLDAAIVEWASKVLRSRNDKQLWRKVEDLVRSSGLVGGAVLAADPEFGSTAAKARTGVSHGGAGKTLDATGLFWYGQILRWVVRARLLMDLLGDGEEAQRRITERQPFGHALKEISSV